MVDLKQTLIIGEKETFLVRVLKKKLEEAELYPFFVVSDVDLINDEWEKSDAIIYYLDSNDIVKEEVLRFLRDRLEDYNKQIFLIGDASDLNFVSERIPSELIAGSYQRPLDTEKFISAVKNYHVKLVTGEFKKTILIVDDDPAYLNLVRSWLRDEYKVAMVTSGLQAIKWLGRNNADLILLDHEMPVTSGPQVLEMLRSDPDTRNIPVIFLTGKSDKESVMAVVALKPEGYLLKNISRGELMRKIHEFFMLRKK